MKVYTQCYHCLEGGQAAATSRYGVDVPESGIMQFTCRNGHDCVALLHAEKYGLLFDSGAAALFDGYPREAVASFASSVERFYEYATKVIMLASGTDSAVSQKVWKGISHQSERQLARSGLPTCWT